MNKQLLILLVLFFSFSATAQNLENITKPKEAVKVSGGLNYSANYMDSYGKPLGREPFLWSLGGSINVSILDVSLPFTYTFSNQGGSYTQPFNFVALHPSYKKFKSHIGTFSMAFSPYSLSGLNVAGGGLEYTSGKLKIQALGGRFQKRVIFDPTINNIQTIAYNRWGGGLSVGYTLKNYSATLIFMKAQDDASSLSLIPLNSTITAKNNFVTSLKLKGTIIKNLTSEVEFASSVLTKDRQNENQSNTKILSGFFGKVIDANQSTSFYNAVNGTISYKLKSVGVGVKYERIDPGYTTLGGLFFNNDLENITLTPNLSLFKGKLNINSNVGLQRNNLESTASNESRRWIGMVNISSSAVKNLSLSASYSNMSSFSRRNPSADPFYNQLADTLNVYQISSSASFNAGYTIGKKIKHNLLFSSSYSTSSNITGRLENASAFGLNTEETNQSTPSENITAMLGHTLAFETSKLNLGWTFNLTQTSTIDATSVFAGPGINCSKPFPKKKLTLNSGVIYNQNFLNNTLTNHVFTARLGVGYQPEWWDKKYGTMSMNLSSSLVNRLPTNSSTTTRDFMLIFGLNYGF